MTIQQVQSLFIVVVVVGLLFGVAGMFSGCYSSRLRSETPAGSVTTERVSGPFYGREDTSIESRGDYQRCIDTRRQQGQWLWSDDQATCYQQTTSVGARGYGPASDHFGYARTQFGGTEYDPAMAGAIRPPPPVPVPPAPASAAPAATAPQGSTDPAALRADVDALGAAVVDLNQEVRPLMDMHCRRHPRRCRRGGGQ